MKYVAVIFAVCFTSVFGGLTDSQKGRLSNYKASCIAESGVDVAILNNIKKGYQVPFDEKLNCFSACMLKLIGIMRQDGTIDEGVARAKAPQDVPLTTVNQIINTCKAQVGKNHCETGGKVMACLLKTRALAIL